MATTASLLPTFPRIFFLYLEPVAITYGIIQSYASRHAVFELSSAASGGGGGGGGAGALPVPSLTPPAMASGYLLVMLLYGLAVLLASPPSPRLLRLHIGILIVADLAHWAALAATLAQSDPRGWPAVLDTAAWSPALWNLATYPVYTLAIKFATLAGWFGKIGG
ncbi:hypothetical protein GGS23DRAFT_614941 [Durotheca rogersii]|uniref:uncharacterized protein n=1 Tax=Durotheca rogersii TaxID=419775 RepID=UPI00221EAB41|nr:uncharacterized protein GGS23DRAFT_614941 [Durotheca rogersii]KAI5866468.1 hypothetical protein GGS23DRAFT_614941 [Durotheca rogersii]